MRNANSIPATRLWTLRELAASYQAVLDDPKKTENLKRVARERLPVIKKQIKQIEPEVKGG